MLQRVAGKDKEAQRGLAQPAHQIGKCFRLLERLTAGDRNAFDTGECNDLLSEHFSFRLVPAAQRVGGRVEATGTAQGAARDQDPGAYTQPVGAGYEEWQEGRKWNNQTTARTPGPLARLEGSTACRRIFIVAHHDDRNG